MRKRNVDKHIWFDRQEAQDLQKKAKKACLTEAALIRLLIRGYEPREKPDERFYDAMRELSFPLSATTSISLPLKQTHSVSSIRKCSKTKRCDGTSFRRRLSVNFCALKKAD